ncbi:MAG: tellurite resistance TerB family protein [Rhodospirillales bacterium]
MAGFLKSLTSLFGQELERQRNRPFLEAVMAAAAMVASVDGAISLAERVRVDQILETLDKLKVFDPHEGVDAFNDFVDSILADSKTGHERALKAIRAVTDEDPAVAQLLIRVCLAISEADGEKSLVDQIEIVQLCSQIGVDPSDCGLYVDKSADDILNGRI